MNGDITAKTVFLVGSGDKPVICSLEEALEKARSEGLDLVEIDPNKQPPICKLMDFGKHLYTQKKQMQESRKKSKTIETKVIRMSFRTESHDLQVKLNQAKNFLVKGHPIKFNMVLHGREVTFMDDVIKRYHDIAESLKDLAFIEMEPKKTGYSVYMILQPIKR